MKKEIIILLLFFLAITKSIYAQEIKENTKNKERKTNYFINLHLASFSGETKDNANLDYTRQQKYFLGGLPQCNQVEITTDLYNLDCQNTEKKAEKDSLNFGLQLGYQIKDFRVSVFHLKLKYGETTSTLLTSEYIFNNFLIGLGFGESQTNLKQVNFHKNITFGKGSSLMFILGYQKKFKNNLFLGLNYFQITNKFKGEEITPERIYDFGDITFQGIDKVEKELQTSFFAFNVGYSF